MKAPEECKTFSKTVFKKTTVEQAIKITEEEKEVIEMSEPLPKNPPPEKGKIKRTFLKILAGLPIIGRIIGFFSNKNINPPVVQIEQLPQE